MEVVDRRPRWTYQIGQRAKPSAGIKAAERAIDRALAPKKRRLGPPHS
jgi:hypothetical protein